MDTLFYQFAIDIMQPFQMQNLNLNQEFIKL